MLKVLREFLNNDVIMFWGTAIHRDVQMLEYYGITIPEVCNLWSEIPNQNFNYPQVSMLWRIPILRPIFLKMIRR
jgi:hypothetical protein